MDSLNIFEPSNDHLPSRMSFGNSEEDGKNGQSSRFIYHQKDSIIDLLYEFNDFSPAKKRTANMLQNRHARAPSIELAVIEDERQSEYVGQDLLNHNLIQQKGISYENGQHKREIKNKISTTYTASIESITPVVQYPKPPFMRDRVRSDLHHPVPLLRSLSQPNKRKESSYNAQTEIIAQKVTLLKQQNQNLYNLLTFIKAFASKSDSVTAAFASGKANKHFDVKQLKKMVDNLIIKG